MSRFASRRLAVLAAALAAAPLAGAAEAPPSPCDLAVPALYDKVSPAVVAISAMSVNPYDVSDRMSRVVGSGVIIDKAGLVLTNSHVVFARQAITITLDDGTSLPAKLVGADPIFDVALVRIPVPKESDLPVATLGSSAKIAVGEDVFAIGNPFGLEQTFTRGIVSAVNRLLPDVPFSLTEPLIQTDAPINPGSSGGPLVSRCGEVIGITTAMLPDAQNIGFAVPVDLVKEVIPSLLANGHVVRPWLGVQGQLVVQPLKDLLRVPLADGFLVEVVEPGSPAEQAGIVGGELDLMIGGQPVLIGGDVITRIDGSPIDVPEKVEKALRALKVGASVELEVFRNGDTRKVKVALTERPLLPEDIRGRGSSAPGASLSAVPAPSTARRAPFKTSRRNF